MNADQNPYEGPRADIHAPDAAEEGPYARPTGHGWLWISDAWTLFKYAPATWIAFYLLVLAATGALMMLPKGAASLYPLLSPLLGAGTLWAARKAHHGEAIGLADCFEGIRQKPGALLLVGLLSLGISGLLTGVGVIAAAGLIGGANLLQDASTPALSSVLLCAAVMALLVMPALMMTWFAPALVLFENKSPFQAMKTSFNACLLNIMPLTVYGLVAPLLLVLGALPAALGLIVVGPWLTLTTYTSYHDIFAPRDTHSAERTPS